MQQEVSWRQLFVRHTICLKSENPPEDAFKAVRSTGFNENEGIQEADFQIDNVTVRTAAVSGLGQCTGTSGPY